MTLVQKIPSHCAWSHVNGLLLEHWSRLPVLLVCLGNLVDRYESIDDALQLGSSVYSLYLTVYGLHLTVSDPLICLRSHFETQGLIKGLILTQSREAFIETQGSIGDLNLIET